jgi:hypothetical protein
VAKKPDVFTPGFFEPSGKHQIAGGSGRCLQPRMADMKIKRGGTPSFWGRTFKGGRNGGINLLS